MSNSQIRKQILVLTTRKSDSTRRNQMDIIADILAAADCGMRKTQIMRICNLSYQQLKAYVDLLVSAGLLTSVYKGKRSNAPFLECTNKGRIYLQKYKDLQSLLREPLLYKKVTWLKVV